MGLLHLTPTEHPDLVRGRPCVLAVAGGAGQRLEVFLGALLAHTPVEAPIVLVGWSAADLGLLAPGPDGRPVWLAAAGEDGSAVGRLITSLAPADIALLTEPCLVGPEWLTRLGAAARADSNTASASALSDWGGPLALDEDDDGGRAPSSHDERSRGVGLASLRLRPRLGRAVGPGVYLRREALELVGGLDEELPLVEAVEIDLAQRCVSSGLAHVAADDVMIGRLGAPPGDAASDLGLGGGAAGDLDLGIAYLASRPEVAASSVLPRALEAARRPRARLPVTVDGRALGATITGTQVHVWHLIEALSATGALTLRVLVGADAGPGTVDRLRGLPGVEVLPVGEIGPGTRVDAVFHRPQQVFETRDLEFAFRLGRRLVVNQLDLIAYRNPGYLPSRTAWLRHRRVTRQALAAADRVIVFSAHTRTELLSDELAGADRLRIVPPGLDQVAARELAPRRPVGLGAAAGGETEMLLCLGTDFRHKNRLFALRLVRALGEQHGWGGRLVFAGTHIPHGSARAEERAYLEEHAELAGRVFDLGPVGDAEKAWLMAHAAAAVYPSVYEGFGLVPFECARAGIPCLFAAQSSLGDVLPHEAATLEPWDERRSAARAHALLTSPAARGRHLALIRAAGEGLTWREAAAQTLTAYREAAVAPIRDAAALSQDELGREGELLELVDAHDALVRRLVREREHAQGMYDELNAAVGSGLSLIGPAGSLPEGTQRVLLALSSRPGLSRPLFAGVGGGFRLARALHRRFRRLS